MSCFECKGRKSNIDLCHDHPCYGCEFITIDHTDWPWCKHEDGDFPFPYDELLECPKKEAQ